MAKHKSKGSSGGGGFKSFHVKKEKPEKGKAHQPAKPPKAIAGKNAAKHDMPSTISPTVGKGPSGLKRKGSR